MSEIELPTYRHWDDVPEDTTSFLLVTDHGFAWRFDEGKSLDQEPSLVGLTADGSIIDA